MKMSMHMTTVIAAVLAALCLGYAFTGFNSLSEIADPAVRADAKAFAWFWAFLGGIAAVLGVAGWWVVRHSKNDDA